MAVQNERVLFSYVPTGQTMPATPDQNTIYFVEGTKQIYVGSTVIADNYSGTKPTFVISGSGDCIVSAEYDSTTNTLTLTYGDFPVAPEYTITRAGTPDSGYSATYQLFKDSVAVGDKINIPKDMVVSSGSIVDITFNNNKLWDGDVDVTEIIKGEGVTPTADDAGPYVRLIVANKAQDRIYIAVASLTDTYTAAQGATQVQLAISSTNEISGALVAGGVGTTELADVAVTTAKIADGAVTEDKIENGAVTEDKISIDAHTESQTTGDLILSVTTTDGQVSEVSGSIADAAVTEDKIADLAVTEDKIADAAVTEDKISIAAHSESQTAGSDGLAISVTTENGQVSAVSGSIAADTYDAYGAASTAESNANSYTDSAVADAIADLDATVSQTAGLDGLALSVTQTDGVLTAVSGSIAANTYDPYGAAAAAVATWTVVS